MVDPVDPDDLYGVLGLSLAGEGSTPQQISAMYRGMSSQKKEKAFEAYKILSNPEKRVAYHMCCLGVPDHYEALQLSDRRLRATPEDIKAQFLNILTVVTRSRKSAKMIKGNPDQLLSAERALAEVNDAFTKAHAAYNVLSNPDSRRAYDKYCWEIEHLLPICADPIRTAEKEKEYDRLCLEFPHLLPIRSEKEAVKQREEDNKGKSLDDGKENKGESLDEAPSIGSENKVESLDEGPSIGEENKVQSLDGVPSTDEEKKEVRDEEKEVREEEKKEVRVEEKEVKPSPDAVPDHYGRLGLSVNATIDEINEKFKALLKNHSDAAGCLDRDDLGVAIDSYRKDIDAYQVLIDPSRRAEYDEMFYRAAQHRAPISADSHKHETPITTLEVDEEEEKEEKERLDSNFSVMERSLRAIVDLNDLYMSLDKDAVDGLHVQDRKNLSEEIEALDAIFLGSLDLIERLRKKFASLKQTSSSTRISGDFRNIRYEAERQHVSNTLDYYNAIIQYEDGLQDYRSFLRSNTAEDACSIYTLSKDVKPDRVCRPEMYFKHDKIPLLSCDNFSHVIAGSTLMTKLASPRAFATIEGYPNKYTQKEIIGILQGVKDLTEAKCMSSKFSKLSFVFTPQKKAKILRADVPLTGGIIREEDMTRLKDGINEVFLAEDGNEFEDMEWHGGYLEEHAGDWKPMKNFLNAFGNTDVSLKNRLDMLITYPFLKEGLWEIVRFFVDVHHSIWLRVPYMKMDLWSWKHTLFNDDVFQKKFLKNRSWARREGVVPIKEQWTDAWQKVFDYKYVEKEELSSEGGVESGDKKLELEKKEGKESGDKKLDIEKEERKESGGSMDLSTKGKGQVEGADKKGTYDEGNIMDLIKFLRHTIIHHLNTPGGLTLTAIFKGINKYWPDLIEMCHERIFTKA